MIIIGADCYSCAFNSIYKANGLRLQKERELQAKQDLKAAKTKKPSDQLPTLEVTTTSTQEPLPLTSEAKLEARPKLMLAIEALSIKIKTGNLKHGRLKRSS